MTETNKKRADINPSLIYFFNLINIAIANRISKNPTAIRITFKILLSHKLASGKLERLVTLVTVATSSKASSAEILFSVEILLDSSFSVANARLVNNSKIILIINVILKALDFIYISTFHF